jgi:excisionase family DNA binding protein
MGGQGDARTDSGPRLITAAEAASILGVSEEAVSEWIDSGLIDSVALSGGERRLRLKQETHFRSGPLQTSSFLLDLGLGGFRQELAQRRFEHESEGLSWTGLDPERLMSLLADAMRDVVPAGVSVRTEHGRIWIAAGATNVAGIVSDDDQTIEERIIIAAERMLETASDSISEITAEPWPARAGEFPQGFPPCRAVISERTLYLSYGDKHNPILKLAPIDLASVLGQPG